MTAIVSPIDGGRPENGGPHNPLDFFAQRVTGKIQAALSHLGAKTARRRARADQRIYQAESQCRNRYAATEHDSKLLEQQLQAEHAAWTAAKGNPDTASTVDQGRRGLSTRWYFVALVLIWLINVPIGIATFQIFEEPLSFTVLLALLADTLLLYAAHASGVTFRRGHLLPDARLGLGLEWLFAWLMFSLGLLAAVAQAWARWQYLVLTGSGTAVGIAFTTTLMLVTFLIAVWAAGRHHNPAVAAAEAATRRRTRTQRHMHRTGRRLQKALAALRGAFNNRRHLAQRVIAKAERIEIHYSDAALQRGATLKMTEPPWLVHERQLAALPDAGAMIQPVTLADVPPAFEIATLVSQQGSAATHSDAARRLVDDGDDRAL
jgi:hypothetical protein